MSLKARKIIGWTLTGLIALIMIGSAAMKLKGGPQMAQGAAAMGLTETSVKVIGIVELLSVLLFILPRTGVLGTLLLAAYLGGAMVTHIEHQQPFTLPALVQALVWTAALIRFPELGSRIAGKIPT